MIEHLDDLVVECLGDVVQRFQGRHPDLVLPVPQALQGSSDDRLRELHDSLWAILEPVDKRGHGLEARYLAVDVVGFEVLIPKEGHYLVDLVEMTLVGVLGNDYLDITPRRFSLLLVPQ